MFQETPKIRTVRDLMRFAIDHLEKKGFDEARLHVELLLAHALGWQRIQLYTQSDKPVSRDELKKFRSLFERRLNREPVQYIIGTTSFMGLSFAVDRRGLIPRPETETLVEQTMICCNQFDGRHPVSVIEIGTGTGNIAVSLAKFVRDVSIATIDNSAEALELARSNAMRHGVEGKIAFHLMDVFEPVDQLLLKRFDVLVSNPPYIPRDEWEQLQSEVRRFEPTGALTDGNDGFEFYRRIVELAPYLLRHEGVLLFEVGFGRAEAVAAMMNDSGFTDIEIFQDLQDIPRVVSGTCSSKSRGTFASN